MHLNILADLANHSNHAPGKSKILFLHLKSFLHLMLEKVLVAIRDWRLWEKVHRQKLLPEHALQWLWEGRQQSQMCKDQSNQTKKAYTVFYLSEGMREGEHLERRSNKKKKKAIHKKHTEQQIYASVFVFISVFVFSSSYRKRRMILFVGRVIWFFWGVILFCSFVFLVWHILFVLK